MKRWSAWTGLLLAAMLLTGTTAFAQDKVGQAGSDVDGTVWLRSSDAEKQSFLIGAGSVVALEYRVREKKSEPPTQFIQGWVEVLKGMSWKDLAGKIDAYYMKNPDKTNRNIFDVMWLEIIKPNMKD